MLEIPPDQRILYFRRDRDRFGFLSHFYPAPIEMEGEIWPTVEHYYQGQKSLHPDYRAAVRGAVSPGMAKQLAVHPSAPGWRRRNSWFAKNNQFPREDWNAVKLDLMRGADWAKFSQHLQLAELLLETGEAELVEDSRFDPFWGVGSDGKGQNWAGKVLMEVRQRLRSDRQSSPEPILPLIDQGPA